MKSVFLTIFSQKHKERDVMSGISFLANVGSQRGLVFIRRDKRKEIGRQGGWKSGRKGGVK